MNKTAVLNKLSESCNEDDLLGLFFGEDSKELEMMEIRFLPEGEREFVLFYPPTMTILIPETYRGPVKTIRELIHHSNSADSLVLFRQEDSQEQLVYPLCDDPRASPLVELAGWVYMDNLRPFDLNKLLFQLSRIPGLSPLIKDAFTFSIDSGGYSKFEVDDLKMIFDHLNQLDEVYHICLAPIEAPWTLRVCSASTECDPDSTADWYYEDPLTKTLHRYVCERDGTLVKTEVVRQGA